MHVFHRFHDGVDLHAQKLHKRVRLIVVKPNPYILQIMGEYKEIVDSPKASKTVFTNLGKIRFEGNTGKQLERFFPSTVYLTL